MTPNDLLIRQEDRIASIADFHRKHQMKILIPNDYSLLHAPTVKYKINVIHTDVLKDALF